MSADVNAAASVSPVQGVYARQTVTSSELLELPDSLKQGWITVQAIGLDVWVLFGDSSVSLTTTTTKSVLTGNEPATVPGRGWRIIAGTSRDFDLRVHGGVTHMAHLSTGTTGTVEFCKSSGKGA